MADRRRRRGASSCHKGSKSKNGRPPTENWQTAEPQWEKKFRNEVGSVPWWRIVETRKVMHYYPNVIEWNDFAVEEAFNREKVDFGQRSMACPVTSRFLIRTDISMKLTGILMMLILSSYWTSIENAWVPKKRRQMGILDLMPRLLFLMNQPVPCTGWGTDEEEDPPRTANNTPDQIVPCAGWGDEEDLTRTAYNTLSGPGLEGNGGENKVSK